MKRLVWHLKTAVFCGEWYLGYEYWDGKPKFKLSKLYYDGHHVCSHIGKFYIGVYY